MNDLISVVVPFYNRENTLERCINSILNQSISNFEIILVDNNSIDGSKEIALKYSKEYNNIYYYNIKKQNVSLARNFGISKSNGNIISFVDSDDCVDKDFLKIMYKFLNFNDLVSCNYTNNIKKLNNKIKNVNKICKEDAFYSILSHNECNLFVWNKLFKKNIIDTNNVKFNEDLKIGEDIDFVFNYLKFSKKVVYINSKLYYYNIHNNNSVNNKDYYYHTLESWINLYKQYEIHYHNPKCLDLICYYYLKKYYELRFYKKNILINYDIDFINKDNYYYKLILFLYKHLTFVIIILKKIKIKLLNRL